ncbi:tyrosine-type recombinase/integrase [Sporosarcina gallistercoris]|uniref:Tyrosine-type recombinase/integrase n=1 Tax=Sporosarcina gallistercoris TaxID=2762245 RepID=A0ABR8PLR6_9BACL|nr:tyrosine-type recombinase/integrase [Sporosarcina gallistercoris]MBD7909106.1 tyrosine-type recombinase/integrase [Sporosarcina gallistercoris]
MQSTIEAFEQWLFEEGRAPRTIESYVSDVKGFQRFLKEKAAGEEQPLSRFSFVRFKEHLLQKNFAVATINKKVNSLKVYNDFLRTTGVLSKSIIVLKNDKIHTSSGSETAVTSLSDEQVEQLLFFVEKRNKVSTRNTLIVYLLLYTGVRVSELVSIKLTDSDFLTTHPQVTEKGGKRREIGLKP